MIKALNTSWSRFVLVGGGVTILDMAIFAVAVYAGLHIALANIVAFAIAYPVHFTLNRRFTFRHPHPATVSRWLIGIAVSLAVMSLSTLMVWGLGQFLSPLVAKGLTVITMLGVNYALNRYVVFGPGFEARR